MSSSSLHVVATCCHHMPSSSLHVPVIMMIMISYMYLDPRVNHGVATRISEDDDNDARMRR
jgi:hypothetical protein